MHMEHGTANPGAWYDMHMEHSTMWSAAWYDMHMEHSTVTSPLNMNYVYMPSSAHAQAQTSPIAGLLPPDGGMEGPLSITNHPLRTIEHSACIGMRLAPLQLSHQANGNGTPVHGRLRSAHGRVPHTSYPSQPPHHEWSCHQGKCRYKPRMVQDTGSRPIKALC